MEIVPHKNNPRLLLALLTLFVFLFADNGINPTSTNTVQPGFPPGHFTQTVFHQAPAATFTPSAARDAAYPSYIYGSTGGYPQGPAFQEFSYPQAFQHGYPQGNQQAWNQSPAPAPTPTPDYSQSFSRAELLTLLDARDARDQRPVHRHSRSPTYSPSRDRSGKRREKHKRRRRSESRSPDRRSRKQRAHRGRRSDHSRFSSSASDDSGSSTRRDVRAGSPTLRTPSAGSPDRSQGILDPQGILDGHSQGSSARLAPSASVAHPSLSDNSAYPSVSDRDNCAYYISDVDRVIPFSDCPAELVSDREILEERMRQVQEHLQKPENDCYDRSDLLMMNFLGQSLFPDDYVRNIILQRRTGLLPAARPQVEHQAGPVFIGTSTTTAPPVLSFAPGHSGIQMPAYAPAISTAHVASNSSAHQAASTVTTEPLDKEEEIKMSKARIKRVLTQALPITGAQPVKIKNEDKRAVVADDWSSSLDNASQETEEMWGWPQHARWKLYDAALTGKEGCLRRQKEVDKEGKLPITRYIRIQDDVVATRGPKFTWRHGDLPGMGDKVPPHTHPIRTQKATETERRQVTVDIADLRLLNERNKQQLKYTNVLCHTTDILHKLAQRNTDSGSADRQLIEDTLKVAKSTLENVLGAQTAQHMSHIIYERGLAMQRDNRRPVMSLLPHKAASARLAPHDSDEFLFGSERETLEKDIKDLQEDQKHVFLQPPQSWSASQVSKVQAQNSFQKAPTAAKGKAKSQYQGKKPFPAKQQQQSGTVQQAKKPTTGGGPKGGKKGKGPKPPAKE